MNDKFTKNHLDNEVEHVPTDTKKDGSPFESIVLSGALIIDDETKTFTVNTEQLKDYLSVKGSDDLLNPIMNLITTAADDLGYSLQQVTEE